jgi:hypothetical protein
VVKTCGEVQDLLVRNLLILLTFMVIKRSGGGAGRRIHIHGNPVKNNNN